jgi:putative hydrolase of the HAD superfamily
VRDAIAVTFDFWNTLVVAPAGLLGGLRRDAVHGVLRSAGSEPHEAALAAALTAAGRHHDAAWTTGRSFVPGDAADVLVASLPGLSPAVQRSVRDAYLDACASAGLTLVPGARETVRALADAGVPLGIVCDVGLTASRHLRGFLGRAGLLDAFDGWAFSDEVGPYKPDPRIFRAGLDALGVADPTRALHVGDLRRTDVTGARGAGMASARFRGVDDDRTPGPEADVVLDHLPDLTPERVRVVIRRARRGAAGLAPPTTGVPS